MVPVFQAHAEDQVPLVGVRLLAVSPAEQGDEYAPLPGAPNPAVVEDGEWVYSHVAGSLRMFSSWRLESASASSISPLLRWEETMKVPIGIAAIASADMEMMAIPSQSSFFHATKAIALRGCQG